MKKNNIAELMQEILKFRNCRDWAQFHDPKNLAEAIAIESGELLGGLRGQVSRFQK